MISVKNLSEANLRELRFTLRNALPGIPSSHVAESLAALFGFRNNAALRAAIAGDNFHSVVDKWSFANRLLALGHFVDESRITSAVSNVMDVILKIDIPYVKTPENMPLDRIFDASWNMHEVFENIVKIMSVFSDGLSVFHASCVADSNGDALFQIWFKETVTYDVFRPQIPQLLVDGKQSIERFIQLRRAAADIAGVSADERFAAARMQEMFIDNRQKQFPGDLDSIRFQLVPNGFMMKSIFHAT